MTAPRPGYSGRTASPRTARAINDRLALELLQQEGPLTATQLKELTGLSRPSVSDLVERLGAAGLVEIVGEAGARRRGPNARLYGIVAGRAHLAAVDVRTHSVAIEIADLLGNTIGGAALPVDPAGDPRRTVRRSVALLERTARQAGATNLHTIAVGAPGLVDPATGELRATGQLPVWHSALVAEVRRRIGVPVLLDNEVNLAALAEQRLGAVRDRDTFVLLWLGHGVGAGLVLGGTLRRGASGGAGEIGFLPVPGTFQLPTASQCEGGFHSLAGSAAVCALARGHGLPVPGEDDDAAAAEAVVTRARGGGKHGELFLDALAARVAIAAAAVCAVLDPGCVVLAGEVGRAGGEALAVRVGEGLARMSPLRTEVRPGGVTGSAVLRGAVLTAMDAAQDDLFTPEVRTFV